MLTKPNLTDTLVSSEILGINLICKLFFLSFGVQRFRLSLSLFVMIYYYCCLDLYYYIFIINCYETQKTWLLRNTKSWLHYIVRVTFLWLIITVEGGHRAVLFDRFRGVQEKVSGEGTHFLVPWVQRPIIFDCRSRPRNVSVITGSKGK